MRWTHVAIPVIIALNGCDDDPFSPEDVAGFYPLSSVDGHDVGWYHDVGAADCQVAFIAGGLEITDSGQFDLDLDYNARCFGTDPFDTKRISPSLWKLDTKGRRRPDTRGLRS